ncbi:hypothetical protein HDV03_000944 [Kappamyces sp. JEL0829]|nr:hypothetical protein HDV03_000944 [Kappamyces sp. JEL0829]
MEALGQELLPLRAAKGHWDGAESNPDTDQFNGKKHLLLKEAGNRFGAGASVQSLLQVLGKPDETELEGGGVSLMPGIAMPGSKGPAEASSQDTRVVFKYFWRGRHDYLWFLIDTKQEKVVTSSWYHALE